MSRCKRIRAVARASGHLVNSIRTRYPRTDEFEFLICELAVVFHLKTSVLSGRSALTLRLLLSPHVPCCGTNGAHDLVVTRATTKIARQCISNLGLTRVVVAIEQSLCRDQEAGRADTALQGGTVKEALLQRMQLVAVGQSFNRFDRAPFHLGTEHQAGTDEFPVERHAAGAAVAGAASFFRANQAEVIAQYI